jgi:deoxyribose-phosphate aldolase
MSAEDRMAAARSDRGIALRLLPVLDLTSLREQDTPGEIEALCAAARGAPVLPAAVCVYPEHVTTARSRLAGTPVRVATVVNFPDGGGDADRAARETLRALSAGAQEIDLVLPYRALLRGEPGLADAVVRACRETCAASALLKVILETSELGSAGRIREASEIAIDAGADFIKTSTGKAPGGATLEAAATMLDVIRARGGRCGLKVAGGIRSMAAASSYLELAATRMGTAWVGAQHFRIGASALFGEITTALAAAS